MGVGFEGLRVLGLWFRVQVSGFGVRGGLRLSGFRCRVSGVRVSGFRVRGSWFGRVRQVGSRAS